MRVEGATSNWVNATLQDVVVGRKLAFYTCAQFKEAMVQWFKLVIKVEKVQKQLQALKQTSRVAGYVQKFQELHYRLLGMTEEEAFYAFLFVL